MAYEPDAPQLCLIACSWAFSQESSLISFPVRALVDGVISESNKWVLRDQSHWHFDLELPILQKMEEINACHLTCLLFKSLSLVFLLGQPE